MSELSSETIDRLVDAASAAREKAHAPYSEFTVGAAVLGADGRVHVGCNVENASYGLSVCAERHAIATDGQARLWWDETPVDVFYNTTPFHEQVASRVRFEAFAGATVPFLACNDLAVFKAFFDRTKDWADLEEMAAAGTLDVESVLGVLVHYLGGDDPRVERLRLIGAPQ